MGRASAGLAHGMEIGGVVHAASKILPIKGFRCMLLRNGPSKDFAFEI